MDGLLRITETLRQDHYYLSPVDECYYMLQYKSGVGFAHNPENRFVGKYKMAVDKREQSCWYGKLNTMNEVRIGLARHLPEIFDLDNITLVPIPPSKTILSHLYDDRNQRVLHWLKQMGAHVQSLLHCKRDIQAVHHSDKRPTVLALKSNLLVDIPLCRHTRKKIVLFDDVLTTGAHYTACKEILLEILPTADIAGVFIARRALHWQLTGKPE